MFLACIPRKMLLTFLVKGIPEENKVWKEENKFNFQYTIWDAPEHLVEKTLESPLGSKKIKPVSPKGNQPWIFIGRTDVESSYTLATWCKQLIHWKSPWYWERLRTGREGDDRGWDGWMASPIWWTWVWANSERLWRTEKPGMLQSMELQRVWHEWTTTTTQNKYLEPQGELWNSPGGEMD